MYVLKAVYYFEFEIRATVKIYGTDKRSKKHSCKRNRYGFTE